MIKKAILLISVLVVLSISMMMASDQRYIEASVSAGLVVVLSFLFQSLKVKNFNIDLDDKSLSVNRDDEK